MVLRLIGVLGDITIERTTVADESALRERSTCSLDASAFGSEAAPGSESSVLLGL